MTRSQRILAGVFWATTFVLIAGMVVRVFAFTPTEASMGDIQKIFYLHLPMAISTFLACLTCFVASVGFLWQRRMAWDHLALSSAKVAVTLCGVVLLTGMIWGKHAWGQWWTWSPRLTFSLVLWLLYVVYLVIRPAIDSVERRALIGAVYGIVAFVDVPLVYLSVRLMPDIHPVSVELASEMKLTLALCFVPVVMLTIGMIVKGYFFEDHAAKLRRAARDARDTSAALHHHGGLT